jgi:hypothetical protein
MSSIRAPAHLPTTGPVRREPSITPTGAAKAAPGAAPRSRIAGRGRRVPLAPSWLGRSEPISTL